MLGAEVTGGRELRARIGRSGGGVGGREALVGADSPDEAVFDAAGLTETDDILSKEESWEA